MRQAHEVRIVAGRWRGRRLRFPAGTAIRPTPDRVRETLFNWLAPYITGTRVLDAFAGSGALGLEALSRGACAAVFIESDARCVTALRTQLAQWIDSDAKHAADMNLPLVEVRRGDALGLLAGPRSTTEAPYDLVFVDPPFASGCWTAIAERLERGGWLADDAFIYLEYPARDTRPTLPASWQLWRSGTAGEVGYDVFRRKAVRPDPELPRP